LADHDPSEGVWMMQSNEYIFDSAFVRMQYGVSFVRMKSVRSVGALVQNQRKQKG
jgi:hypothetical protein